MAEQNPPEPPADSQDDGPSDAARQTLKGLIRETLDEWAEDNKPDPGRTQRPTRNIFQDVWNFGGAK